jgi:hypothetical protein
MSCPAQVNLLRLFGSIPCRYERHSFLLVLFYVAGEVISYGEKRDRNSL